MTARVVVSADEHLVEPPEFWNDWLPQALPAADRAAAPRLEGVALVVDGQIAKAFELFPNLVARSDVATGASDVAARLAVMDSEGVDVSVVFPQRAMGMFAMRDRELMMRCFDAYNTWLAARCAESGGRLQGVAVLPTVYRPEATADMLARITELGLRTFMLPNALRGASYADPELEPLWAAIEESGMPLCFHISESPDDNGPGGLGTYLAVSFQPFRKLWSYLVFSGILERHPGLRIVFAEGGISWIPSALEHADHIHRAFGDELQPRLPREPSSYWYEQCWATFMDDPRGVEQIDHIGADRVLWSSDYPHPEGTFGYTRSMIDGLTRDLGEERARGVLGANALDVFGFDPIRN